MDETDVTPKPMGELDRLFGVLFDPGPAFADIAARPRWYAPIILLTAVALVFLFLFTQRVGWERFLREQTASHPRLQQLTPEQREQVLQQQLRFVPVLGYVQGAVGAAAFALILAGVYLFVFNILTGNDLSFASAFGVVSYAIFPYGVKGVLGMVLLYLKEPAEFDLLNPVASNVGAFLNANTVPAWVVSVGNSVDLFTFWVILLLATGFSAAARRLTWSSAFRTVLATWAVWLVAKGLWVWIWG